MFHRDNLPANRFVSLIMAAFIGIAALAACSPAGTEITTNTTNTTKSAATAAVTNATTAATGTGNTGTTTAAGQAGTAETDSATNANAITSAAIVSAVKFTTEDQDTSWNDAAVPVIILNGSSISSTANAGDVAISGSTVTITAAGTYEISGTLAEGQIIVQAGDDDVVRLVLDGLSATCTTSAPINVLAAKKLVVYLADGSKNQLTFGVAGGTAATGDSQTDDPNAAIYSMADLTINGSGSLTINANTGHGLVSKDKLKILGGVITINAAADGIKGRDYVAVQAGSLTINAGSDGIQSNNDEDTAKGFVYISGGDLNITAGKDGIQAATSVLVSNGNLAIASGGDGIHANTSITINDGILAIEQSYEAIESSLITVNGGKLNLTSSDDGFNVAGDNDGSAVNGRPGQNDLTELGNYYLNINGGSIVMDAGGDGLDSNGSITMTGGTVLVCGPTDNGNGAIDYNGTFKLTGGYLLAVGSSGMAEAPDASSTQPVILVNLTSTQSAGTLIHIASADGQEILTFQPAKAYQSIAFSSASLELGATYKVLTGGSSTGTAVDGLYSAGSYSGGTEMASLTLSGMVTTSGTAGHGGPGGGRR